MVFMGTLMSTPVWMAAPLMSCSFFTVSLPMCSSLLTWSSTLGISTLPAVRVRRVATCRQRCRQAVGTGGTTLLWAPLKRCTATHRRCAGRGQQMDISGGCTPVPGGRRSVQRVPLQRGESLRCAPATNAFPDMLDLTSMATRMSRLDGYEQQV